MIFCEYIEISMRYYALMTKYVSLAYDVSILGDNTCCEVRYRIVVPESKVVVREQKRSVPGKKQVYSN